VKNTTFLSLCETVDIWCLYIEEHHLCSVLFFSSHQSVSSYLQFHRCLGMPCISKDPNILMSIISTLFFLKGQNTVDGH
jgi:hypothetical protein